MKCRQCGTVNVPSAKFCSHCGASLSGGMVAEGIAAKVEPSTVAIPAGGHAELTVSVRNDTHLVEHVDLSIDDPTEQRRGAQRLPPSRAEARAGRYVRISSASRKCDTMLQAETVTAFSTIARSSKNSRISAKTFLGTHLQREGLLKRDQLS